MLSRPVTALVVLCVIALSVSATAYQLYPLYLEHTSQKPAVSRQNTSIEQQVTKRPTRDIASYALFGAANSNPTPVQQTENLPETKLRLTLTGVSASSDTKSARALIEGPDRNTESYAIGDTVPGNATLHEVHPDRVVLSRGGKLETLGFPDISSGTRLLSTVIAEQNTEQDDQQYNIPTAIPGSTPTLPNNTQLPTITSEQKQSIRDRLNALRARLRQQQ